MYLIFVFFEPLEGRVAICNDDLFYFILFMKKIILLVFICFAFIAKSQVYTPINNYGQTHQRIKVSSNFKVPFFSNKTRYTNDLSAGDLQMYLNGDTSYLMYNNGARWKSLIDSFSKSNDSLFYYKFGVKTFIIKGGGGVNDTAYAKLNYNNEFTGVNEFFDQSFFANQSAFRGVNNGGTYFDILDSTGVYKYLTFRKPFKGVSNGYDTVAYESWVKNYVAANGASPAGSSGEIQYNNAGSFGANSGFTFDGSSVKLPELKLWNSPFGNYNRLYNTDAGTHFDFGDNTYKFTLNPYQNSLTQNVVLNIPDNSGQTIPVTFNGLSANNLGEVDIWSNFASTSPIEYNSSTGTYSLDTSNSCHTDGYYNTLYAPISVNGTVTSVALTTPTGLTTTGSPITSNGTLVINYTSGYSLPTTASQALWDAAYTNRITTLTTTGASGAASLSSNTLNVPNYTLTGLGGIDSIRLANTGVLHTTPATFSKVGTTGVITQALATQTAYRLFGTGNATATPTFRTIDSNYFNGSFASQVRAAQTAYTAGRGTTLTSNAFGFDTTRAYTYNVSTSGANSAVAFYNGINTPTANSQILYGLNIYDTVVPTLTTSQQRAFQVADRSGQLIFTNQSTLSTFSNSQLTEPSLHLNRYASSGTQGIYLDYYGSRAAGINFTSGNTETKIGHLGSDANAILSFYRNNTEQARFASSTGNFLVNTTTDGGDKMQIAGSLSLTIPGNKLKIATGTNASVGTATLSSGNITVNTTAVTASSIILLQVILKYAIAFVKKFPCTPSFNGSHFISFSNQHINK